jgi:hypothetical protein
MDKYRKELKELCDVVVAASLYWTGEDEKKNPLLKRMRTLARMHLEEMRPKIRKDNLYW